MILDILRLNKETKMQYWQLILLVIIITILAPISVIFVQDRLINNEPTVEEIVQKGEVVLETLHLLKNRYAASRMYLGRFYNGTFFTDGSHFTRWVVTHQISANAVTNLSEQFTEFPVTFLADVFNTTSKNGYSQYHLSDLSTKGVIYNIMRSEEMESLYMFSVHSPEGKMIAAAILEFKEERVVPSDELMIISQTVDRLSGFILYE